MRKQSCSWVPVQSGKTLNACTRVIWSSDAVKPEIEDIVSLSDCRQIKSPDGKPASLSPCKLYFDLDLIELHVTAPPAAATCIPEAQCNREADCERIANSDVGKEGSGRSSGSRGGGCTSTMSSSPFLHQSSKSCTLSSPKSSSCSSLSPSSSARTSAFIPCFFFSDAEEEEIRQAASSSAAAAGSGAVTGCSGGRKVLRSSFSTTSSGKERAKIELHKISILSAAKNIELYQCAVGGEKCYDKHTDSEKEEEESEDDDEDDDEKNQGEGSPVSPLSQGDQQTCWQNNSHDSIRRIGTNSFPAEKKEKKDKQKEQKRRRKMRRSRSSDDEYIRTGRGELIEDAADDEDEGCGSGEVSMYSASVQIDTGKSVRRFRINLIPRQASLTANLWIFAILIEIRNTTTTTTRTTPPFSLSSLEEGAGKHKFWESLAQNMTPFSSFSSSGIMAQDNSFPANAGPPDTTFPNLMLMSNLMMHAVMSRNRITSDSMTTSTRQRHQDSSLSNNNSSRNRVRQKKEQEDSKCGCNHSQAAFPVQQPAFSSSSSSLSSSSVRQQQNQLQEGQQKQQNSCGSSFPADPLSSSLPFPFSSSSSSSSFSYHLPNVVPNASGALAPMTGTMYGCSLLPDIRSQSSSLTTGRRRTRLANDGMHADTSDTTAASISSAPHDYCGDHLPAAAAEFDVHLDHEQETGSDEGTTTGKLSFHQQQQHLTTSSRLHAHDEQRLHDSHVTAAGIIRRSGEERGRECDTFPRLLPSLGSSVSSVETLVVQSDDGQLSDEEQERVSAVLVPDSSSLTSNIQEQIQGKNRHANHHSHPHYDASSHCHEGDDHLSHFRMMQFLNQRFNQLFQRLDQMDERIGRIEGHLKLQGEQEK